MLTIKQIEAVYWAWSLGSFLAAADRLNTTQSAISKRIQELELDLGGMVFDRSKGKIELTPRGRAIIDGFGEMLALRNKLLSVARVQSNYPSQLRLGVTEMVAHTWLPVLVEQIRREFTDVFIQIEVNHSRSLYNDLKNRKLDIVIGPLVNAEQDFAAIDLDEVECVWTCSPDFETGPEPLSNAQLARLPIIMQPDGAALQFLLMKGLAEQAQPMKSIITCNDMPAILTLTKAGQGISYSPINFCRDMVKAGELRIIETEVKLPTLRFVVAFQLGNVEPMVSEVVRITQEAHRAYQKD